MPFWFDHLFFLTLVVLFPLRAAFSGMRRLRRARATELSRVRLSVYREAIVIQWGLLAVLALLWIVSGRSWRAVGAVPRPTIGFMVIAGLTLVGVVVMLRQRAMALKSDEALESVHDQMRHLEVMLPHEPHEVRWFYRLSFTAGVCEEFLYRGYMIWYLAAWMPVIAAAGVSSLIFGLGHAYQGRRGVLTTGLFGALLATVYLISGSLLIPMALHMLLDMHSGHLAYRALLREAELDRERAMAEAARRAAERAAMASTFDVIVIGLGAMGSAAVRHLAMRGARVVGFDRFHPPHEMGSSHGESRLIREAYFEAPWYVPIVQRAYDLWQELERESGRPLIRITGGLMIGPRDCELVKGALESARAHGLPVEWLEPAELRRRHPAFHADDETGAVWEPRTGMLFPEACIATQLERAAAHGAMLRFDDPVFAWRADGEGVEVETASGRWRAGRLLLTNGAWLGDALNGASLPLRVSRQTLHWFEPVSRPEQFDAERFPSWIREYEPDTYVYGFPRLHGAVKAALHMPGATVAPDALAREATPAEGEALAAVLRRCVPDMPGRLVKSAVCMYTNTPDAHFVIDTHPAHPQVLIASACSGHGFKFSIALGEVFADLLLDTPPRFDLAPFRLDRFAAPPRDDGGDVTASPS